MPLFRQDSRVQTGRQWEREGSGTTKVGFELGSPQAQLSCMPVHYPRGCWHQLSFLFNFNLRFSNFKYFFCFALFF